MVLKMNVSEKVKCEKINKFYFRDPKGRIRKYLQFCRRLKCKTESSYNYENLKPKYCFKHKKENMVNVKRGHKLCKNCKSSYKTKCTSPQCKYTIENYPTQSKYMKLKTIDYLKETKKEFYLCRLCENIVDKNHFFTEEHIQKFNNSIQIDVLKSFEYSFISIRCVFVENRYNYLYSDLYFKKHIKDLILKNVNDKKYYKSYILKKHMITFNNKDDHVYFSEKFNSNNIISDIDNIENLEKNEEHMKPYLIKTSNKDYKYNLSKMYEDINKINQYESGNSIKTVQNIECYFRLSECSLIKGCSYENIPEIFKKSKIINIIKNNDEKCFIYCYIRKFINPVKKHSERVCVKDKNICTFLEDKFQYNFDNVKIKDLPKIEDFLKTNIYVYTCNKDLKEDLRNSLISDLDYIENTNEKVFDYPIDMSTFDQKIFDEITHCKYCNYDFKEKYNNCYITLTEKVDKYLKRIIDDKYNDINKETLYKSSKNYNQFYNIVRSSIIHKDMLDLDFVNSMITIIIYLSKKHKLNIPNIEKYQKDRENILKQIDEDRLTAKKLIISILNGGFQQEYHKDTHVNKFLKEIENESKMLHNYFYKIDKRIDEENINNLKGKNFSRILQDYENKLLMILYDYLTFHKYKIMSLIFDGILILLGKPIIISDIEEYIYKKTEIPMKLSVKRIKDHFTKFGESNIDFKDYKKNYKITTYVNKKVIHHNHMLKENNIIDYICQNCNFKIKNKNELVLFFHNSKGYDNAYMIDIFSKIKGVKIECLALNKQRFKLLTIKIPNKKYKIKIVDSLAFLQSNLNDLSSELDNHLKILTKHEFGDKFEYVNKKLENFPYDYLKKDNLDEENLPSKKHFYNKLTLKSISDKKYKKVKEFYKNMEFKNLDQYLECYLKSDITLLADIFNNFRKNIFLEFEIDVCKYISAPSLSKDIALKQSKVKIENVKDVSIFQFVKNSIMGGLSDSIKSNVQLDNNNQTIAYMDISSQYPYEMTKKLPISNYKFVDEYDENIYRENRNHNCILLCDIKSTDEIKNDHLFKQCPPLVSRTKITDKNLSQFQLDTIKLKMKNTNKYFIKNIEYDSISEKLIPNLGNDSNVYLNHEMYQMFIKFGYDIKI